jgi:hypothetical protein
MAEKSNTLTMSKPEFLKTTSGIEEFLQLETEVGMTNDHRELANSSLIKKNEFKSPQKSLKADTPKIKGSKSSAHLKHHYPVTPLVFNKGNQDLLGQLKQEVASSSHKQPITAKSTTRRLESGTDKRKPVLCDESDRKRQLSNQQREVQKFHSDKKPVVLQASSGQRSPKKDGLRPNSSVLSLKQERLSLRDMSSSKQQPAKAHVDVSSQLLRSDAHRSSTQKARRLGNSSQLNASLGQSIEREMDQASRHKLQAKVRQYYQQQLSKVTYSYQINFKFTELEFKLKEIRESIRTSLEKEMVKITCLRSGSDPLTLQYISIEDFDLSDVLNKVSGFLRSSPILVPIEKIDLDRDLLEFIKKESDFSKQKGYSSFGSFLGSPLKRPKSTYQLEGVRPKANPKTHIVDSMVAKHRDLKRRITGTNMSMEEVEEERSPSKSIEQNAITEAETKDPRSVNSIDQNTPPGINRPHTGEDKKKSLINLMCKTKTSTVQALAPLFNK